MIVRPGIPFTITSPGAPAPASSPVSSTTFTSYPGTGFPIAARLRPPVNGLITGSPHVSVIPHSCCNGDLNRRGQASYCAGVRFWANVMFRIPWAASVFRSGWFSSIRNNAPNMAAIVQPYSMACSKNRLALKRAITATLAPVTRDGHNAWHCAPA